MKNLVGVLPDRAGATVRSALRHPGPITYGLYGTKYKPTFCHGDNLRKYTINQFSWFVNGLMAMGNYLEEKGNLIWRSKEWVGELIRLKERNDKIVHIAQKRRHSGLHLP
jgi:hypothetical protein